MDLKAAMEHAVFASKQSACKDKQVGCMLLDKDWAPLDSGYNVACLYVTVYGECLKDSGGICEAVHAEVSALNSLIKRADVKPYIAVCTLEPCYVCARHLYDHGVREVYFAQPTNPSKSGKHVFLSNEGTKWEQAESAENAESAETLDADTLLTMAFLTRKANGWDSIFNYIREYHKDLGYPTEFLRTSCINVTQKQQLRDMVLALTDEAHEALSEVDWKPWKKYNGDPKVNLEKFLEETGDILFFIDGMLMTFGLSWDDLANVVEEKLIVNRDRMGNGYHD